MIRNNDSINDIIRNVIFSSGGLTYLEFQKLLTEENIVTDVEVRYLAWTAIKFFNTSQNEQIRLKKYNSQEVERRIKNEVDSRIKAIENIFKDSGSVNKFQNPKKTVLKYKELVRELCDETGIDFVDAMQRKFPNFGKVKYV